jgi:hypothetical protein
VLCGKAVAAMWPFPHFLSEKVKVTFKDRRFSMVQGELQNMLAKFQTLNMWKCFGPRYDHWSCCINSQGDYLEDNID